MNRKQNHVIKYAVPYLCFQTNLILIILKYSYKSIKPVKYFIIVSIKYNSGVDLHFSSIAIFIEWMICLVCGFVTYSESVFISSLWLLNTLKASSIVCITLATAFWGKFLASMLPVCRKMWLTLSEPALHVFRFWLIAAEGAPLNTDPVVVAPFESLRVLAHLSSQSQIGWAPSLYAALLVMPHYLDRGIALACHL